MRLKEYTKENIVGKQLVEINFTDTKVTYRVVEVVKITDKSVMLKGATYSRRSFSDLGYINYGGLIAPIDDVNELAILYFINRYERTKKEIARLQKEFEILGFSIMNPQIVRYNPLGISKISEER